MYIHLNNIYIVREMKMGMIMKILIFITTFILQT